MLLPDLWLVQRARHGDKAAFGKLFDRHSRRVFHLLRRLSDNPSLAEDLTQETFLTAWQSLERWRGRGALSTWLCGIAVNHWRTHHRQAHESVPLDEALVESDSQADPLAHCTQAESLKALEQAVAALPESYREVFVLVRIEELSYQEVAQLLELPLGTVQSRLHRATRLLKTALTAHFSPDSDTEKETCHVL
ncbi:RNA polymerase sigma factor [Armatimonas rosea]|uniref:RNA polymerase sigma factor n=1 Tax=Armatimonas rosea TaxID=685828 RepID=A0A7W9W9E4_ARMRO|nr:sigma-70 family RNA polymerase sigma factor [Armatimonas rosea]MBB6053115.1 RNA polymerase sigma-70 factor (ECF subfamily) [Armatimonas rosea]